jgi:hypothetical protein
MLHVFMGRIRGRRDDGYDDDHDDGHEKVVIRCKSSYTGTVQETMDMMTIMTMVMRRLSSDAYPATQIGETMDRR